MIPASLRMFAGRGSAARVSRTGFATNCSIGQPLADGTPQRDIGTACIVHAQTGAVVVSEIELGGVAVQVMLGTMLGDADHPAFEHAVEAFGGVGVDIAVPDIFAAAMGDEIVSGKVLGEVGVLAGFVAHHVAFGVDVRLDDREQVGLSSSPDVEGHDPRAFRAAFHQGHDRVLVGVAPADGDALLAADEGFIDFDDPTSAAEGGECAFSHRLANAVREEPCSLHAARKHPLDLVGADALLAGAHQMNGLQPKVQP